MEKKQTGIEVKPGKSYAYQSDSARTKLRVTQASIGTGKSNARSTLQINVGQNKPVILCNLLPNVCENFSMELELKESETVLFSVLGERSVHLAGYHIDTSNCKWDGNDSDSTGEDICNSKSSGSDDDFSDLDRYESDFIDDDDEITNSPPPKYTSKERKEASRWNASSRSLKKRHQVSDADDYKLFDETKTTSIFNQESDDSEDSIPLHEKTKSRAKASLNTENTSVIPESSPSKEGKVKKKKNKKDKEEKGIVVVSPSGVVEEDGSVASERVETGKKKKSKKQKEASTVVSKAVHSENGGVGKKKKAKKHGEATETKMGENPLATNVADSEVASDNTQSPKKGSKRSKKRSKDESRLCGSEVADEDNSDAKKLKKGDAINEDVK